MDVPFMRPEFLATDFTPTIDVVLHALQFVESNGENYDAVCILQPTCPFRKPGLIDNSIEKFFKSDMDSLASVKKVPPKYNPHWIFKPDSKGFLKISTGEKDIITRRQDLPDAYIRDGSIYIIDTKIAKKKRNIYGESLSYIEHNYSNHVNIDNDRDWEAAEQIILKKTSQSKNKNI